MKKGLIKMIACVVAITWLGSVLCSCALPSNKAGDMVRSIMEIGTQTNERPARTDRMIDAEPVLYETEIAE